MKINRLLEMVTILLNRKTITAKELAERFEVSTRTVYRDIEALSTAGIPIYTNKGSGGGISLLEDYTLNKALLSKSESESLLLAVKAMGATSYPEADAILDKLGSVFKNNKAHDWIEVGFDEWGSKANEQDRFSKIRDAIISNRVISFDYINARGEKSTRLAEPIKLIFNANTWYLIAYCLKRNSHRMFRLSRIKEVSPTDQHFENRPPEKYVGWETSSIPFIGLRLCCAEKILGRLYDTFDEEYITKNDDGTYAVQVTIPEDEWVYGYILSLGGYAEVLEPEHVRQTIKARAQEIIDKY
ncbi:MAG: YafY family transcriptional regulator [Eggerthellaceae bacterium]|nr:YafY family transcriptional regulator [Eggerthellaceae bacterium]